MDPALFITDDETRKRALVWRLNAFKAPGRCPTCGEMFQRTHVDRCGLFPRIAPEYAIRISTIKIDMPELSSVDILLNFADDDGKLAKLVFDHIYANLLPNPTSNEDYT